MPELTFYRQGRCDGGIRTGIELDERDDLRAFRGRRAEDD